MKFYVNRHHLFVTGDEMPDTSHIPPMQRRKMSRLTLLALGIAEMTTIQDADLPLVYASRFGEWGQTLKQMLRFLEEKEISPAGFSFSVHNTAPGQFSILKKNHKSYTAISGADRTFDAGLLEAATALLKEKELLFICAGEEMPSAYRCALGEEFSEFAIGLRIGRLQTEDKAIPLVIDFTARNSVTGDDFLRVKNFASFLGSALPLFSGHCYSLSR